MPDTAGFWSGKFSIAAGEIAQKMEDMNAFHDFLRAKLMKRGGIGYVQPTPESFPTVEEFHRVMQAAGALPCSAWLDGTSDGEQHIQDLLGLLIEKGVVAKKRISSISCMRSWTWPGAGICRCWREPR
jgi:hypothetical protein